jgi:hypothetical protein
MRLASFHIPFFFAINQFLKIRTNHWLIFWSTLRVTYMLTNTNTWWPIHCHTLTLCPYVYLRETESTIWFMVGSIGISRGAETRIIFRSNVILVSSKKKNSPYVFCHMWLACMRLRNDVFDEVMPTHNSFNLWILFRVTQCLCHQEQLERCDDQKESIFFVCQTLETMAFLFFAGYQWPFFLKNNVVDTFSFR